MRSPLDGVARITARDAVRRFSQVVSGAGFGGTPVIITRHGRPVAAIVPIALLEHHRGRLPAWLAPTQLLVLPVDAGAEEYAQACARQARDLGLRCRVEDADRSLGVAGRAR